MCRNINCDIICEGDIEGGRLSHVGTKIVERRTEDKRGLEKNTVRAFLNNANTNGHSVDDVTNLMVKEDKRQAGHNSRYTYYAWTMLTSVFNCLQCNSGYNYSLQHA